MLMSATAPASIAPTSTYFERANELKAVQPFVAHHIRLFGLEMAMKMSNKSTDAQRFLLSQMDILELEKKDSKFTTPPTIRKAFTVSPPAPPPAPPSASASVDVSDDAGKSEGADRGAGTNKGSKGEASDIAEGASSTAGKDETSAGKEAGKEADTVSEELSKLAVWGDAAAASASATSAAKPKVGYRQVAQTPTEALRSFALDLYERARAADDPKAYPSPSTPWGVVEAPKIARGLHASAVILDGLKQWGALPPDLAPFQTAAHKRSQQLGAQINQAFKSGSPVPLCWAPVDVAAPFKGYTPPAPPPPTAAAVAAMFPSAPTSGPVRR